MNKLPDIDRSMPGETSRPANGSVNADETKRSESVTPGPSRVKRTSLTRSSRPSQPPEPRSTEPQSTEPHIPDGDDIEEVTRAAPFLDKLDREHLSPLAGLFLVSFFFFIYFNIIQGEDDPYPLLGFTLLASLFGAAASWFWLKADQLDRVQANFLAAILAAVGLVVLYTGAKDFGSDAWKMLVSVFLVTLGTICFLMAGVVKRL